MRNRSFYIGVILGFLILGLGMIMIFYRPVDWTGPVKLLSGVGEPLRIQIVFPPYYFLGFLFVTAGALVSIIFTVLIPENNDLKRASTVLS
jgi:hypothetical protein